MPILDSLMFAVALAVAAIPEALSSIVTIVQAMGTQKMVREHAIIKDLKAVESLGCVSIVCSDKTGTLTQNKMTVQSCYLGGQVLDYHKLNPTTLVHKYFLYTALLTNDSAIAVSYTHLDVYKRQDFHRDGIPGKQRPTADPTGRESHPHPVSQAPLNGEAESSSRSRKAP